MSSSFDYKHWLRHLSGCGFRCTPSLPGHGRLSAASPWLLPTLPPQIQMRMTVPPILPFHLPSFLAPVSWAPHLPAQVQLVSPPPRQLLFTTCGLCLPVFAFLMSNNQCLHWDYRMASGKGRQPVRDVWKVLLTGYTVIFVFLSSHDTEVCGSVRIGCVVNNKLHVHIVLFHFSIKLRKQSSHPPVYYLFSLHKSEGQSSLSPLPQRQPFTPCEGKSMLYKYTWWVLVLFPAREHHSYGIYSELRQASLHALPWTLCISCIKTQIMLGWSGRMLERNCLLHMPYWFQSVHCSFLSGGIQYFHKSTCPTASRVAPMPVLPWRFH